MALAPVATFLKDPDAVLDYGLDWTAWLAGDTIASSVWSAAAGLTSSAPSFAAGLTQNWLSGGVAGTSYLVRNRITTVGGRTEDRSILINVADR